MVYVDGKKYACETCIKGHRSSSCKHHDRPLYEIKKKGRPVTQCEHCRELRKTRQIHVKCVCESKDILEGTSASQGGPKVPARAAFPSGLPEDLLEASVASQPFSENSDSDHSSRGCTCKDSATCTCWTPRNRGKRPAKASERRSFGAASASSSTQEPISHPAALVVHAHAGNNRPVLPKPPPPAERTASPPRSTHNPSAVHTGRLPIHNQSLYSPYSRAYEYSHGSGYPNASTPSSASLQNILNDVPSPSTPFGSWPLGADTTYPSSVAPPTCGCGPSCTCPGCVEHQGHNADPSAACSNPANCLACLDCNLNTLAALASDANRAPYDPSQDQNIDEWLRQVSSMPDLPSTSIQSPIFPPGSSPNQPGFRFDPSMMQSYEMWNEGSGTQLPPPFLPPTTAEECCGGRCQCPAGLCACPSDCCGCCQGCQCSDCMHTLTSGRTLTFATSGERGSCCGGRRPGGDHGSSGGSTAGPSTTRSSSFSNPAAGPSRYQATFLSPTLDVPRQSLSRTSSSSSKSSPHPSTSTSSSSPQPYREMSEVPPRSAGPGQDAGVGSCCSSMGNLTTNVSASPTSSRRRGSDHNEYRTLTSNPNYQRRF